MAFVFGAALVRNRQVERKMGDVDGQVIQHVECESGLDVHKVITEDLDDDGRSKRTGTIWTASAHIITAVIGSGVLSLAWAVAQLGWVAGVVSLLIYGCITFYTSNLLAECYRSPTTSKRNYTYMEAVKDNLGGKMKLACGMAQYANLSGMVVGYTVTAAISMVAIEKSNCFHRRGREEASCEEVSPKPYMIGLAIFEIFLSQIPNIEQVWWLSIMASVMSFAYSSIGAGLAFAIIVSGHGQQGTIVSGAVVLTGAGKMWRMFTALGDIALAYSYSPVLIEVQDTLRSSSAKPETKVMKKANMISVGATTVFYMMCGCMGYAAFGNSAPGNMLTGFGFYEPFWLIDLANIFIVLHLAGAYQVMAQPVFCEVESWCRRKWPESKFVNREYPIKININMGKRNHPNMNFSINLLKLFWRSMYVVVATAVAVELPFFNELLALIGAVSFWPLTVYFPITMYISRRKMKRTTIRWFMLQFVNLLSLLVALVAACGSIQGLGQALHIKIK